MYSFQIIQVDVGQGDCTVIIIRQGDTGTMQDPIVRTTVIDCGGGRNGINDLGDTNSGLSLYDALVAHNVQHIDIVVISHYDQDHLGGITGLLKSAYTNNPLGAELRLLFYNTIFYDRGEPGGHSSALKTFTNRSEDYGSYIEILRDLRLDYVVYPRRVTELVYARGRTAQSLKVISPFFTTVNTSPNQAYDFKPAFALLGVNLFNAHGLPDLPGISLICTTVNQYRLDNLGLAHPQELTQINNAGENDMSLTLLFRFGTYTHWLSGELLLADESQCIQPLSILCPNNRLSSMKVSHHGSEKSTSSEFLDTLGVRVALISCGPTNKHDHPRAEVLDSFFSRDIKVLLTGWGGDLQYLEEILYNHPFSFHADILIAGSSLPETMMPGNISLLSSELILEEDNSFTSLFFTQNFWYVWLPWNEYDTRNSPLGDDLLPGVFFLLPDGDFNPDFELLKDGSITWLDENGQQVFGRYVRRGDWALIPYQLH